MEIHRLGTKRSAAMLTIGPGLLGAGTWMGVGTIYYQLHPDGGSTEPWRDFEVSLEAFVA